MRDYHINVFSGEEDGGYIADIPDLDSCSAFGATPQEAVEEVMRAREAWLAAAREDRPTHSPAPLPAGSSVRLTLNRRLVYCSETSTFGR